MLGGSFQRWVVQIVRNGTALVFETEKTMRHENYAQKETHKKWYENIGV